MISNEVTRFINRVKDILPPQIDISYICKNGKCYQLALLLREVFKDAIIYYDPIAGHVYTKIDKHFYDIDGIYWGKTEHLEILDHKISHAPHRWRRDWNPVDTWLKKL